MYTAWYTTSCEKYLNNIIEQYHRFIKTDSEYAWIEILANGSKIIVGIEAMYMIKRTNSPRGEVCPKKTHLIDEIFGLTA